VWYRIQVVSEQVGSSEWGSDRDLNRLCGEGGDCGGTRSAWLTQVIY
jgi:hypothetical protein